MSAAIVVAVLAGGVLLMLLARAIQTTLAIRRVGADSAREYDMVRVAEYAGGLGPPPALLPEQAWNDLDMDQVFRRIDRTVGWPGQHLLYARMRREDHLPDAQRQFDEGITCLVENETVRARIRAALTPLAGRRASALPTLFQRAIPPVPAAARAAPVLSLVSVGMIAGAFWWPPLVLGAVVCALVNTYMRVAMRDDMIRALLAAGMVPVMQRAATALARLEAPALRPLVDDLRRSAPRLHGIARAARWLSFEPTPANEILGYLYEYVNLLLLLDVSVFIWTVGRLRDERDALARTYAALGELDVMQGVAALRLDGSAWVRPESSNESPRSLSFTALVHPLLESPVANSLTLDGQSVLLTGSNMSGKSTFIRTIGVNAVLANTLNMVFAERWVAPRYSVRTSIGRADSLLEGKSYYLAEVEGVRALLDGADTPRLSLIDELFRGTNTIERVAAAKAVLAQLERNHDLVIMATHDVELLDLLPEYVPYHFREEIVAGELAFDYRLHAGRSATRNALAILEAAGYPAAVVEDARAVADAHWPLAAADVRSPHA